MVFGVDGICLGAESEAAIHSQVKQSELSSIFGCDFCAGNIRDTPPQIVEYIIIQVAITNNCLDDGSAQFGRQVQDEISTSHRAKAGVGLNSSKRFFKMPQTYDPVQERECSHKENLVNFCAGIPFLNHVKSVP